MGVLLVHTHHDIVPRQRVLLPGESFLLVRRHTGRSDDPGHFRHRVHRPRATNKILLIKWNRAGTAPTHVWGSDTRKRLAPKRFIVSQFVVEIDLQAIPERGEDS